MARPPTTARHGPPARSWRAAARRFSRASLSRSRSLVRAQPGDNFYLGAAAKADPRRGGRYLRFTFVRSLAVLREGAQKLAALRP